MSEFPVNRPSEVDFGKGHFVGDINDPKFFDLTLEEQARFLAQRAGCPVATELISEETGRGPEAMSKRYAEVSFWYGYIGREIEKINPELNKHFAQATPRLEGEPVGKYEDESVPANYTEVMSPINSLPDFSLPRMLIEQINNPVDADYVTALVKSLKVLEDAIAKSTTTMELMARTAEGFAGIGGNVEQLSRQMLAEGWMKQHNALKMMGDCKDALKEFAPTVWNYYEHLSSQEKDELGLVS